MIPRIFSRRFVFVSIAIIVVLWVAIINEYNRKPKHLPQTKNQPLALNQRNDLIRAVKALLKPRLTRRKLFLLIIVLSSPENVEQRDAIRTTWATHSIMDNTTYQVVFLLGQSNVTARNVAEAKQNKDILFGEFNDTYRTLVSKTFFGMRWAIKDTKFQYLLKCDDDVYLNIPRLIKWLQSEKIRRRKHFYSGHIYKNAIPVREHYKNALTVNEYSNHVFPSYAAGPAYILSRSSVYLILKASESVQAFFIEDAYVGCLAERAGITPHDMAEVFDLNFKVGRFLEYGACELLTAYIFGHNLSPSYLKKLHAKVEGFLSLNTGTVSAMCFQEWLLYIYKTVALVIIIILCCCATLFVALYLIARRYHNLGNKV